MANRFLCIKDIRALKAGLIYKATCRTVSPLWALTVTDTYMKIWEVKNNVIGDKKFQRHFIRLKK